MSNKFNKPLYDKLKSQSWECECGYKGNLANDTYKRDDLLDKKQVTVTYVMCGQCKAQEIAYVTDVRIANRLKEIAKVRRKLNRLVATNQKELEELRVDYLNDYYAR